MNKYRVEVTYVELIDAENLVAAENQVIKNIQSGKYTPDSCETNLFSFGVNKKTCYVYEGVRFEERQDVIDALLEDAEIDSFRTWLAINYDAYEILTQSNTYNHYFELYKGFQETCLNKFIECGHVKIEVINE